MSMRQYSDWHAPLGQQALTRAGFASCDGLIGPFAYVCRHGRFDLTLLFEDYFLALLPSAVFILVAFARISQLWGAKPKTIPSSFVYLKLVSSADYLPCRVMKCTDPCTINNRAHVPSLGPSTLLF